MNIHDETSGPPGPDFEAQLRADEDECRIDYDAVLAGVLDRIDAAEALGPLAAIKSEMVQPLSFWENIERKIGQQVREFSEYDQPVQEHIAMDQSLTDTGAIRVENSVNMLADSVEKQAVWEQVLRADEVVPVGDWERLEQKLSHRLNSHPPEQALRVSWPLLQIPLWSKPVAWISSVAVIAIVAAIGMWQFGSPAPVPLYVYQTSGELSSVRAGSTEETKFSTRPRAAMTIVSTFGFVRLSDGAELKIDKVSGRKAQYQLSVADVDGSAAEFFFEHREKASSYGVTVPGFHIEVTGTYFTVSSHSGVLTTNVLEGTVVIHPDKGATLMLSQGQTGDYSLADQRWTVRGGGEVVDRNSIEKTPSVEVLAQSVPCTFQTAGLEGEQQIVIDRRHIGSSPAAVLLAPGRHSLRILMHNQALLDTTIQVVAGNAQDYAFALSLRGERVVQSQSPVTPMGPVAGSARKLTGAAIVGRSTDTPARVSRADSLMAAVREVARKDWRRAARMYREALKEASSDLQRQNALFALGAIYADRGRDKVTAKKFFREYRSNYPSGLFAGETLLRLAELSVPDQNDSAIAYYRQYLELSPESFRRAEVHFQLALLLIQTRETKSAVIELELCLQDVRPTEADLRRRAAQTLVRILEEEHDANRVDAIRRLHLSESYGRTDK